MSDEAVTPLELARALHRFNRKGNALPAWDDLPGRDRDTYVLQARQALDHLSGKRMTDASRTAIARLESAAYRISEDVQEEVHKAVQAMGLDLDTVQQDARTEGIEWCARELDRQGLIDLMGGESLITEALRRMMREGVPVEQ